VVLAGQPKEDNDPKLQRSPESNGGPSFTSHLIVRPSMALRVACEQLQRIAKLQLHFTTLNAALQ
jgi:hypothetical protein